MSLLRPGAIKQHKNSKLKLNFQDLVETYRNNELTFQEW